MKSLLFLVYRYGGRILPFDLSRNPSLLARFILSPSSDSLTYITRKSFKSMRKDQTSARVTVGY